MKGKTTAMIASVALVMTGAALLESPALLNSVNQRLTNEQQTPVLAGTPRRRSGRGVQPIEQQTPVLARSRRGGRGQRGLTEQQTPVLISSQNRGGYEV